MAGLTTTQTFSDGDTVTAAKLNNIVSNCSIDADAVTTAKILDANVTLGKMATNSVDTGQLVNLAVSNAKLDGMTRGTVKVGDSSGAASDLDAKTDNAFLTGDGTDIKSKTFDSATAGDITITSTASNFYLEIASNSIANAMLKNDSVNTDKISHSTSGNPGVIIYGASGVPSELTTTASTAVLTSAGSGAPTWKSHNKTISLGNIPAAGDYAGVAHGLGAAPVALDFYFQCTIAEHSFLVGDRLFKKASRWESSSCEFGADGTYVWFATDTGANTLKFFDKPDLVSSLTGTSPSYVTLTTTNWDLYAVVGT